MGLKLVSTKLSTNYERKTRTTVDTVLVTAALLETWKSPPFQRPVRENEKVRALAEQLKADSGVWPGIVTLGVLDGDTYIIDGQHRRAAFVLSGLSEGYTDVRIHHFTDMASMGEEFVNLNSQLVRMRPDDILRGLEGVIPELLQIREACPFVSYDQIRRGTSSSPVLSMSAVLRAWRISNLEVPGSNATSATILARSLPDSGISELIAFLRLALASFGRDVEYYRLWGALNLTLCMWLYRRTVITKKTGKKRTLLMSAEQFGKCLMSLSADSRYLDWLVGRLLSDRDRSPAYRHIRDIFALRLKKDLLSTSIALPQPAWFSTRGSNSKKV